MMKENSEHAFPFQAIRTREIQIHTERRMFYQYRFELKRNNGKLNMRPKIVSK